MCMCARLKEIHRGLVEVRLGEMPHYGEVREKESKGLTRSEQGLKSLFSLTHIQALLLSTNLTWPHQTAQCGFSLSEPLFLCLLLIKGAIFYTSVHILSFLLTPVKQNGLSVFYPYSESQCCFGIHCMNKNSSSISSSVFCRAKKVF